MDRFTIQALEADTRARQRHRADQTFDAIVLGMGNRNPPTDSGRTEQLTLEHRPNNLLRFGGLQLARTGQAADHFPNDAFLGRGGQLRNDGVANHKISHAHAGPPLTLRLLPPAWACWSPRRPRACAVGLAPFPFSGAIGLPIYLPPDPFLPRYRCCSRGRQNRVCVPPRPRSRPV